MAAAATSPTTGIGNLQATLGSANSTAFTKDASLVYNDLNSGNYQGAWNTALSTSSMFGTNMGAATTDPLLQAMETSQGLSAFDPNKKWNAQSLDQYYNAFNNTAAYHGNNAGSNGYLGKNPYGLWGSAGAISSGTDQKANLSQEGATPDVARFAGAKPSKSFLGKYGTDIAALGLAVAAPYAIGALAPEIAGGAAIASGGATGAATGLIGSAGAGALYGAGSGALLGGLSGGNVGKDALLGGLGGGIMAGASTLGSYYGVNSGISSLAGKEATGLATNAVNGGGGGGGNNGGYGNVSGSAANGQGNNNGMASTDQTLGATLSGALPGILQAGSTAAGALAGSNAIQGAENNVITTNQNTLGNINSIWAPQKATGNAADNALTNTMTGGPGGTPNYSGFENMPGYQFAVSQGTQAINRQAAAMGSAYTPNTAAAVGQYVTGTAMNDYNTYINQLMGAAGLGTSANQGLQTGAQNANNNIGTAQQNIGEAQQSAYNATGSAANGLFSPNGAGTSLVNAGTNWLGKALGGNSGSNSGSNSGNGNSGNSGSGWDTSSGGANGGVDPSTGVPYDIQAPGMGSAPAYDPTSFLNSGVGGGPSVFSDPNWNSVTDTTSSGGYDPLSFLSGGSW